MSVSLTPNPSSCGRGVLRASLRDFHAKASCECHRTAGPSSASECRFLPLPSRERAGERGRSPGINARQRGAALFLALVALAILTLAGLALVRSVDTGNLIAGNFAFKEASAHAADTGIETALSYVSNTVVPAPDNNLPTGCTAAVSPTTPTADNCRYYARTHNEDSTGLPTGIDWNHANLAPATVAGYQVQYVVDRLCNPDPSVVVNLGAKPTLAQAAPLCYTSPADPKSSKKGGVGPGVSPTTVEVFYRVTVRVTGPRNTVTMLQTIVGRST